MARFAWGLSWCVLTWAVEGSDDDTGRGWDTAGPWILRQGWVACGEVLGSHALPLVTLAPLQEDSRGEQTEDIYWSAPAGAGVGSR